MALWFGTGDQREMRSMASISICCKIVWASCRRCLTGFFSIISQLSQRSAKIKQITTICYTEYQIRILPLCVSQGLQLARDHFMMHHGSQYRVEGCGGSAYCCLAKKVHPAKTKDWQLWISFYTEKVPFYSIAAVAWVASFVIALRINKLLRLELIYLLKASGTRVLFCRFKLSRVLWATSSDEHKRSKDLMLVASPSLIPLWRPAQESEII